jgi:hypothetical protein
VDTKDFLQLSGEERAAVELEKASVPAPLRLHDRAVAGLDALAQHPVVLAERSSRPLAAEVLERPARRRPFKARQAPCAENALRPRRCRGLE